MNYIDYFYGLTVMRRVCGDELIGTGCVSLVM